MEQGDVDSELERVAAEADLDVEREEREDHLPRHRHEAVGEGHGDERPVHQDRPHVSREAPPDGRGGAWVNCGARPNQTRRPPRCPPGAARGGSRARTRRRAGRQPPAGSACRRWWRPFRGWKGPCPALGKTRREGAHGGRVPRGGAEADQGRRPWSRPGRTRRRSRISDPHEKEGRREDAARNRAKASARMPKGRFRVPEVSWRTDSRSPVWFRWAQPLGDRQEHDRDVVWNQWITVCPPVRRRRRRGVPSHAPERGEDHVHAGRPVALRHGRPGADHFLPARGPRGRRRPSPPPWARQEARGS